jgi:hypothetical protein
MSGARAGRRELLQRIAQAFGAEAPPPQGAVAAPSQWCDPEREEIAEALGGKRWTELALPVLRYHHEALIFLAPEAFRYYLPAYLSAAAGSYRTSGSLPGSVVSALTPPEPDGPADPRFQARFGALTPPQSAAVAAFVAYMRAEHGRDYPRDELGKLLERYWGRFLPPAE